MSPKEKAIELVQKMFNIGSALYAERIRAKQCALILVDECLHTCVESMIYYWQEVKTEIEKL